MSNHKTGDTIMVANSVNAYKTKAIFIKDGRGDTVICVAKLSLKEYKAGLAFGTYQWLFHKQYNAPKIVPTVSLNGKEMPIEEARNLLRRM